MPTDDMLRAYQRDKLKQSEKNYLETVLYQFGRYLFHFLLSRRHPARKLKGYGREKTEICGLLTIT